MKLTQEQYEKIAKHLPFNAATSESPIPQCYIVLDKVFTSLKAEGIINVCLQQQ